MNIKLIPVGNGSKFAFPALPEKIQGKEASKYQIFDIISQGTVKVPKGTDVTEITWDGVFFGAAKKNEPIVQKNYWKDPIECVNILNSFKNNGTVLNLIVTETWINLDVTISSFQPRAIGAFGNIEYSITFAQYKELKIYDASELKVATFSGTTRARSGGTSESSGGGQYTVASGDTLSRIAQSKCGGAGKWTALYNANSGTIEAAAKSHGRANSDHGHWIYPGTVLQLV